jgi:hypothetical protein
MTGPRASDKGRGFTRLSPAIDVRQNYRGADVVATLERAAIETRLPKTIRVDNGPEFVSKELDLWAFMRGVALDFSRPGKPTDNAFQHGQFSVAKPGLPGSVLSRNQQSRVGGIFGLVFSAGLCTVPPRHGSQNDEGVFVENTDLSEGRKIGDSQESAV